MSRDDALMRVRVLGAMYRHGDLTAAEWADEVSYVLEQTFPDAQVRRIPLQDAPAPPSHAHRTSTPTGTQPLAAA